MYVECMNKWVLLLNYKTKNIGEIKHTNFGKTITQEEISATKLYNQKTNKNLK